MTSFILKIIALSTMFCDHLVYALTGHLSFWNYIGRIAFQISEGFTHTKDLKKYFIRLILFAVISQIPFHLYTQKFIPSSTTSLNIFFTLLLGLLAITIYDYFKKKTSFKIISNIIRISSVLIIALIGHLLKVDYGFWGIIVIFAFYFFKNNKLAMTISYIYLCIIHYGYRIIKFGFYIQYIYLAIATILPIIFINLYNGKQGHKIKYLLYLFYPIHLLLLYLFM